MHWKVLPDALLLLLAMFWHYDLEMMRKWLPAFLACLEEVVLWVCEGSALRLWISNSAERQGALT
jgi:hypothetical protein